MHEVERDDSALPTGASGPMGRILICTGPATTHPELYRLTGEPVINKPGKGAFYQTDLD